MNKILIVDDEQYMRWVLRKALIIEGFEIEEASTGEEAIDAFSRSSFSLIIIDLKLTGINGIETLKQIKEKHGNIPAIMITAHGSIESAIEAIKVGAFNYITKPFELDELIIQVKKAMEVVKLTNEVEFLRNEVTRLTGEGILETKNSKMQEVYDLVYQLAESDSNILITGESGTGKEIVARAIHKMGNRSCEPFVAVNCAALPETLIESELFGYEKGAFTGAINRKSGRFEIADKGTLFLDEIGDIPLLMQTKLLRAIQEKEFERVGGTNTIKVNTRIVAATNKELESEIASGNFRRDLYYRLKVVELKLPPLRDRKEDIFMFVQYFINKYCGKKFTISNSAMEALLNYSYPGNIRELQNAIERASIISIGNQIEIRSLPPEIVEGRNIVLIKESANIEKDNINIEIPDEGINLEGLEINLIKQSLRKCSGNKTRAANLLGITRSALIYRIEKYNIKQS